jgi:hypothetical protein
MEENKTIQLKHIDEITFDIENARIPISVGRSNETNVLEWMINHENIIDLMNSIGAKGFFPGEPLLVTWDEEKGKFITIEGNRRYTATYLLQYPEKAPVRKSSINDIAIHAEHRPDKLPVLEFGSRDEIVDYLGYRHITGVEPWDALAKARYLRILYDRLSPEMSPREKYRTLARQIGSNLQYVRQILIGGKIVEVIEEKSYYDIKDLNDKTFEFGSFYTAIVRPNIAKYINLDLDAEDPTEHLCEEHLKELVSWMFEKNGENQTRLGESRNLSRLNRVLDPKYPRALEMFKNGETLTKAAELTDEVDIIVKRKIGAAVEALQIAWSYFPSVKKYQELNPEVLKEINKTSAAFYRSLIDKIQPTTDLDELA